MGVNMGVFGIVNNYSHVFDLTIFVLHLQHVRAFSSVGLEHYLDRVGVTGSNPVMPTENVVITFRFPVKLLLRTTVSLFY
jgi:hypothetical protein